MGFCVLTCKTVYMMHSLLVLIWPHYFTWICQRFLLAFCLSYFFFFFNKLAFKYKAFCPLQLFSITSYLCSFHGIVYAFFFPNQYSLACSSSCLWTHPWREASLLCFDSGYPVWSIQCVYHLMRSLCSSYCATRFWVQSFIACLCSSICLNGKHMIGDLHVLFINLVIRSYKRRNQWWLEECWLYLPSLSEHLLPSRTHIS